MESGQAQCGALTTIKETTSKKKKKRRETDGRRLTDKEDRTHPPPPSATKTSQADTGQGQRLLVNTQHAGDKKALT